jgi:hypothetical protein
MNQYSSPGFGQYPQQQPFVEQRTSVMAVLSLVFALICCPPGPSALGVLFGVAALIAIGRSNDRLVGRGLAISGIIIGLIVCAIWLGISIGAGRVWDAYKTEVATPLLGKLKAMEEGNYTEFRTLLTPETNARITDADIDALRAGYQAELGKIVDTPTGFMEIVSIASEARDAWTPAQNRNDLFPLITNFEKGPGIVLLQFDPAQQHTQPPGTQQFVNIIISSPKRSVWKLWDPQRLPPTPPAPPLPSTPQTTPEAPADTPPDAPAGEPDNGGGG